MKVFLRIVKISVLIVFSVLLIPILVKFFTPWREALYVKSDAEMRRQVDAYDEMIKGGVPDAKFMIGNSFVTAWLPRDFEKSPEGVERVFYKVGVLITTPSTSTRMPKLENVRIRLCEDEKWTDFGAYGKCELYTKGGYVENAYTYRLPDRFEPQEGANVHVQVVVSVSDDVGSDKSGRRHSKTFEYVYIPEIRSGWCGLWHWLTNL